MTCLRNPVDKHARPQRVAARGGRALVKRTLEAHEALGGELLELRRGKRAVHADRFIQG